MESLGMNLGSTMRKRMARETVREAATRV